MATVKKGVLSTSPEWWKHLRPYTKRQFWKSHRKYEQRHIRKELQDA
ncbi:MAG: hypothetical protein ACXABY_04785 [Candidatus Thorarchaeota archaeon]|jgi:hypothetical protein